MASAAKRASSASSADVVCPIKNAFDLHRAWPESRLVVVPDAGHSASEPGTVHELVSATDHFAS